MSARSTGSSSLRTQKMIRLLSTRCCSGLQRVAFAAVAVAVVGMNAEAAIHVYRPMDPSEVVLRLGSAAGERRLAQLRATSRTAPDNPKALIEYVDALIESGAQSGNERYYGYAEQVLNATRIASSSGLLLRRARLLQHRHEFRDAERLLGEILIREPRDRDARLMRAQIRLHLHEPQLASRDCAALAPLVSMLTTATCIAQVRAASGDLKRSYALLATTLRSQRAEDETRSWSAGVAAELSARLGNARAADHWYREAFSLDPGDHYIRITYADWLLSEGRNEEAAKIAGAGSSLADRARVVLAGNDINSMEARKLQLAWREAAARGERGYLREQARFELIVRGDRSKAHALALESFRQRGEPEDALLLARTAAASDDRAAMAAVVAWHQRYGYEDVRLDRLMRTPP